MTNQNDTPEKIEKQAKMLGERLAWLMAASSLPDDVKEAYMTLLPEMSMEQIDQLMQMLEKNVASAAEIEATDFIENIKAVQDHHKQQVEETQKRALTGMEEIERLLNQAEQD